MSTLTKITLTAIAILVIISVFLFGYVMRDLTEYSITGEVIDLPVYVAPEITSVGSHAGDKV